MTITENVSRLSRYVVPNLELLPLKIHMFLYFGAVVGVMPFATVIAKQLGISASLVGMLNTALLFVSIAMRFLIGSLTDKVQRLKIILIVVISIESFFHFMIIVVPPITPTKLSVRTTSPECISRNNTIHICFTEELANDCPGADTNDCTLSCTHNTVNSTSEATFETAFSSNQMCGVRKWCSPLKTGIQNDTYDGPCIADNVTCSASCLAPDQPGTIRTPTFWLYAAFRVLAGIAFGVGISLTDAATYAILRDRKEDYGKQRLWGTIGWGGMAPLVGYFNQMATGGSSYTDYSPGFYMLAALAVMDILGLVFLEVPQSPMSKQLLKDVREVFVNVRTLFFTFAVFNMGFLMGFIWTYGLWYLEELGASPQLLGANLAVQCFGGEVPVLFFSGWIIRKIGYGNAVSLSIGGLALRFAVYSYGTDVWAMLPVEITHGLCFGLFYAALTSYASTAAPPGTEATMQGILGGTFEGLGIASGTLVAGHLYDYVGGRATCRIYLAYCLVFLVFHVAVDCALARMEVNGDFPVSPCCFPRDEHKHKVASNTSTQKIPENSVVIIEFPVVTTVPSLSVTEQETYVPDDRSQTDNQMTIAENVSRLSRYVVPNLELLPLKIHMFLYCGAVVGVMPFATVIAKQLGISASLVGVLNTALLFVTVVMRFLIGSLTDKVQRLKIIIIVVISIESFFHFMIIVVPPITPTKLSVRTTSPECISRNNTIHICFTEEPANDCPGADTNDCSLSCTYNTVNSTSEATFETAFSSNQMCGVRKWCRPLKTGIQNDTYDGLCIADNVTCSASCLAPDQPSTIRTPTFWLYAVFRVLAGIAFGVGMSLTDAAAYAILRDRKEDYGKQRLWGTIGWGGMAPLVGYFNQMATGGSSYTDYSPGFYMLAALAVMDILGLVFLEVPQSPMSKQLLKDVREVFVNVRTLFFTFAVFNMGFLMGFIWTYGLWYLQELGASPQLLGANLAVQCFGGEVPVLFFSGWIIRKIGYGNAVSLSIGGMALRFAVYSYGTDVWAMLPVEVTHGLCFGLFYAALTSYASTAAPPGTEATMQGILGGTFEGLGK
ncbi:unnamed protein product, partial [Ixodes hexagonus]